MRQVSPAREGPLKQHLETGCNKQLAPLLFATKRAGAGAPAPLQIVAPTNQAIHPSSGHVFVHDCQATPAQYPPDLAHHCVEVLCVMQDVAQQHRVELSLTDWEVSAIVALVINWRRCFRHQVDTNGGHAQQRRQVMSDKPVAATDIEHARVLRQDARCFEGHIIGPADGAATPLAPPPAMQTTSGSHCDGRQSWNPLPLLNSIGIGRQSRLSTVGASALLWN